MNNRHYKIAFFGSSLVSAYWNGAATYYRGIIKALDRLGHQVTFFEPDAFERQKHRDLSDPPWAEVSIYQPDEEDVERVLRQSRNYDIVIKASGVGVFDRHLEEEVLANRQPGQKVIFWDVDAPATLASIAENPDNPFRKCIPHYDLILTYGGGPPVIEAYEKLNARRCVPIYNALDPDTHHETAAKQVYKGDLAFLGNRLPDREERMDTFFFSVAESMPEKEFILGGSGWDSKTMPENIRFLGHVYTEDHNAFNASPTMVLNINRDSMAQMGYSPATRVFEAAGAGACLITDDWIGLEEFLEPGREVLVAENGADVARLLNEISPEKAKEIGQAALRRVRSEHTYKHRAHKVTKILNETFSTSDSIL